MKKQKRQIGLTLRIPTSRSLAPFIWAQQQLEPALEAQQARARIL